jgi:DnaJ-class molecular chaperone
MSTKTTCPTCNGWGDERGTFHYCGTCGGAGTVTEKETAR